MRLFSFVVSLILFCTTVYAYILVTDIERDLKSLKRSSMNLKKSLEHSSSSVERLESEVFQ